MTEWTGAKGPTLTERLRKATSPEIYVYSRDAADEIERLTAELEQLQQHNVPPERRLTHYRGNCGHEWLKSQSDDCPYCHIERLEAAIRYISAETDDAWHQAHITIDLKNAVKAGMQLIAGDSAPDHHRTRDEVFDRFDANVKADRERKS